MMMKNDRGMTLVEVLAALTILGIVFVGFMTIFPQMTLFNEKTNDKLVTMNLARQELANIQTKSNLEDGYDLFDSESTSGFERYYKKEYEDDEKNDFVVTVDYYIKPDLNKEDFVDPESDAEPISLHKIHIEILKDGKKISETFGYIEDY